MPNPITRHYAAAFCLDGALMLSQTAMPFFVYRRFGGSASDSAAVGAILALSYAIACIVCAKFVRPAWYGLKLAALGAATAGACLLSAPFMPGLAAYTLALIGGSAFVGFSWPAMHTWIAAETDLTRRARLMALFNIAWSCGLAAGSLCSGPLFEIDVHLPFIAAGLCAFGTAVILRTQPDESEFFAGGTPEVLEVHAAHAGMSARFLPAMFLAAFYGFALLASVRFIFPKRLDDLVARSEVYLLPGRIGHVATDRAASLFSVLAFSITLTSIAVFAMMGRTTRWQHRFWVVTVSQILATGSIFALAYTHSLAVMTAAFAIVGANAYMTFFTSLFYCVADPRRKHRLTAFNEFLVGFGAFAGSAAFGAAAWAWTLLTPFFLAPLLGVAILGAEYALLWRAMRPSSLEAMPSIKPSASD